MIAPGLRISSLRVLARERGDAMPGEAPSSGSSLRSDEIEIHVFERSLIGRDADDARAFGDQLGDDGRESRRRQSIGKFAAFAAPSSSITTRLPACACCAALPACRTRAAPS